MGRDPDFPGLAAPAARQGPKNARLWDGRRVHTDHDDHSLLRVSVAALAAILCGHPPISLGCGSGPRRHGCADVTTVRSL